MVSPAVCCNLEMPWCLLWMFVRWGLRVIREWWHVPLIGCPHQWRVHYTCPSNTGTLGWHAGRRLTSLGMLSSRSLTGMDSWQFLLLSGIVEPHWMHCSLPRNWGGYLCVPLTWGDAAGCLPWGSPWWACIWSPPNMALSGATFIVG